MFQPGFKRGFINAAFFIIVKGVFHLSAIQPFEGLLHGIAVFDAVYGEHGAKIGGFDEPGMKNSHVITQINNKPFRTTLNAKPGTVSKKYSLGGKQYQQIEGKIEG
jgi:hypothetical protein